MSALLSVVFQSVCSPPILTMSILSNPGVYTKNPPQHRKVTVSLSELSTPSALLHYHLVTRRSAIFNNNRLEIPSSCFFFANLDFCRLTAQPFLKVKARTKRNKSIRENNLRPAFYTSKTLLRMSSLFEKGQVLLKESLFTIPFSSFKALLYEINEAIVTSVESP